MPNGIDLLLADHEFVDQLFTEFDAAPSGATVGQIIDALKGHDDAEHAALYPMSALALGDAALIARCEAAHSAVKRQIDLVAGLEGAPLTAAVSQLRALVTAHVKEEEQVLFPALTKVLTGVDLEELGARIHQAKQRGG